LAKTFHNPSKLASDNWLPATSLFCVLRSVVSSVLELLYAQPFDLGPKPVNWTLIKDFLLHRQHTSSILTFFHSLSTDKIWQTGSMQQSTKLA